MYAGLHNGNKYTAGVVFSKQSYFKEKEHYEVKPSDKIPAIITPELFYRCQELMAGKVNRVTQKGIYHGNKEYSGLIFGLAVMRTIPTAKAGLNSSPAHTKKSMVSKLAVPLILDEQQLTRRLTN
jgi:hypothetical protein